METVNLPKDKLQRILEEKERSPKHPLPGVQDKGLPNRVGDIPVKNIEEITSGKSGGHLEPDSDLGGF